MPSKALNLAKFFRPTEDGKIDPLLVDFTGTGTTPGIVSIENISNLGSGTEGQSAFVTSTKSLYLHDGTKWNRVSSGINSAPIFKTNQPPDTLSLSIDGNSTTLNATAVDPEYDSAVFPIEYSWEITDGSGVHTNTSGTFPAQITNISGFEYTGNYVITPSTNVSDYGTLTFKAIASDGSATTAKNVTITLDNTAPTAIAGISNSYSLALDGTATVLTATSTDPEGYALTWSYEVTTGTLGTTATISQADNVFTITPGTSNADSGTFTVTISVTDGTNTTTKDVVVSLQFVPQVDILVVGGGGGGSAYGGAGGGGGEYKTWTGTLVANREYIASTGAGGEDPYRWNYPANAGTRSQFYYGVDWRIRAGGGGGGSTTYTSATTSTAYYAGGGSTGGGSRSNNAAAPVTNIYNSSTDVGTGYRYLGGNGGGDHGGAGGGASEVGANQSSNWSGGGYGGDGKTWLDGNTYAGGGGAGVDYAQYNNVSQGGSGGGGNGAEYYSHNGDHGTGGGGGGSFNNTHSVNRDDHSHDSHQAGTFGGNGIIIIRVLSTAWQPTVTGSYWTTTTSGGYTYYKCVRLGSYNGSGRVDGGSQHNATSLAFEAARGTVTGTLKWQ